MVRVNPVKQQQRTKAMVDDTSQGPDDFGASTVPVIVDLGKKSRKAIKNLKRGTGDTMLEVEAAIRQVRLLLADADKGKPIVPIVIIYERKQDLRDADLSPFRFPPVSPFDLFR
jgi:hypothetical protein